MPQVLTTQHFITSRKQVRLNNELVKLESTIATLAQKLNRLRLLGSSGQDSEYQSTKEEYDYVWSRINKISDVLNNSKIIEQPKNSTSVELGSKVEVRFCESGATNVYQIVGSIEADPAEGKVSFESPIGKGLLGKREGEEVLIESTSGQRICEVVRIF